MTQEDKQLLLKDLSARLPYGVICHANEINIDGELFFVNKLYNIVALYYDNATGKFESCLIDDIKPYLRSLSSMTEEEKKEFNSLINGVEERCINAYGKGGYTLAFIEVNDWLNAHHFDYRGLIEKGFAIEVTEENNPKIKSINGNNYDN